jgi:hypothetical protein
MEFQWKVVNAEIFTEAQEQLNKLDLEHFEILTTHSFSHEGKAYLSIIARKHKPKADIRY